MTEVDVILQELKKDLEVNNNRLKIIDKMNPDETVSGQTVEYMRIKYNSQNKYIKSFIDYIESNELSNQTKLLNERSQNGTTNT